MVDIPTEKVDDALLGMFSTWKYGEVRQKRYLLLNTTSSGVTILCKRQAYRGVWGRDHKEISVEAIFNTLCLEYR